MDWRPPPSRMHRSTTGVCPSRLPGASPAFRDSPVLRKGSGTEGWERTTPLHRRLFTQLFPPPADPFCLPLWVRHQPHGSHGLGSVDGENIRVPGLGFAHAHPCLTASKGQRARTLSAGSAPDRQQGSHQGCRDRSGGRSLWSSAFLSSRVTRHSPRRESPLSRTRY